jgi:hypothetical protein
MLNIEIPKGSSLSDTRVFNHAILQQLPDAWWKNDATIALLSYYAKGSKLVFLRNDSSYFIINEEDGLWDGGVWYSNTSFRRSKYASYFGGAYSHGGYDYGFDSEIETKSGSAPSTFCSHCEVGIWKDTEIANGLCSQCAWAIFNTEL